MTSPNVARASRVALGLSLTFYQRIGAIDVNQLPRPQRTGNADHQTGNQQTDKRRVQQIVPLNAATKIEKPAL